MGSLLIQGKIRLAGKGFLRCRPNDYSIARVRGSYSVGFPIPGVGFSSFPGLAKKDCLLVNGGRGVGKHA
jgi:hypothetical protein